MHVVAERAHVCRYSGNDGNDVEVSMSSDSDSEEVPVPSTGRPSRRTAEVSRAQIRTLAGQGLL